MVHDLALFMIILIQHIVVDGDGSQHGKPGNHDGHHIVHRPEHIFGVKLAVILKLNRHAVADFAINRDDAKQDKESGYHKGGDQKAKLMGLPFLDE